MLQSYFIIFSHDQLFINPSSHLYSFICDPVYVSGSGNLYKPFGILLYIWLDTYVSRCHNGHNHNSSYQVLIQLPNSAFTFLNSIL